MKERFLIILLALVAFGSGFGARAWTERTPELPPAPTHLGSEFTRSAVPAPDPQEAQKKDGKSIAADRAFDRSFAIASIQRLRTHIDTYQKRMDELDAEFERNFLPILTPEQRASFLARKKGNQKDQAQKKAEIAADTSPMTDEQYFYYQREPLFNVLWSCSINSRVARLQRDLKLEDSQLPKTRELVTIRRDQFLALVESVPAPSILYSGLANFTDRLGVDPVRLELKSEGKPGSAKN